MLNRILGIIGWVGTALVLAAVAVRFLKPEWSPYQQYLAWAGLACVLAYLAGQWREVGAFYKRRQARYGTLSIVSILVVLGILIAVNYLASRQNKRWDLTANQVYSLSDQTVKVLQGLDAPVKFTVYDQETNFDRFRDRLEEYAYHSTRVTTEYVDMDRQPARAKQAQVQQYGTLVIEYKDRTERVTNVAEQDITNALIKAVTGEARKVYFTQGHGEKDPTSSDRLGYASVSQLLTRDNYGVERVVLAQQKDLPADATAVIIAGPRTDFLQPEIEALQRYLAKGGKVMFLLDPPEGPEPAPLTNLTALLKEWGINAGNDVVLDASGIGQVVGTGPEMPVAAKYPAHAITDRFEVMTAYPLARSISVIEGGANGRFPQPLVETSAQSWAEANLKSLTGGDRVAFNAGEGDRQGPIVLAAAVSAPATDAPAKPEEKPAAGAANGGSGETPAKTEPGKTEPERKPESRIVAFGDSDFAANGYLGFQGNRDFFVNAVNWIAQQENLIAIRAREPEDRRLTLTADQQQRIMLLSVFVVPGLVLAAGVYNWWRRR
jgi:ABC-type uncharacterized transport system involved in gliding motility auxiliary subunit